MTPTARSSNKRKATAPASSPRPAPIRNASPISTVIVPTDKDIISARGNISNKHSGNIAYRKLISDNFDNYLKCKMQKKVNHAELTYLKQKIKKELKDQNRRFLKKDGNSWMELNKIEIYNKIGQSFRDINQKTKNTHGATYNNEQAVKTSTLDMIPKGDDVEPVDISIILQNRTKWELIPNINTQEDDLEPLPLDTETNHACLAPDDFPNDWLKEDEDQKPAAKKS